MTDVDDRDLGTATVLGFLGGVAFTAAMTAVVLEVGLPATPSAFGVMAGTAILLGGLIQAQEPQGA